jgi:hypothetical protein
MIDRREALPRFVTDGAAIGSSRLVRADWTRAKIVGGIQRSNWICTPRTSNHCR